MLSKLAGWGNLSNGNEAMVEATDSDCCAIVLSITTSSALSSFRRGGLTIHRVKELGESPRLSTSIDVPACDKWGHRISLKLLFLFADNTYPTESDKRAGKGVRKGKEQAP